MRSLQKYEKQIQELARLVNIKDYMALQLEYITEDATFDEIAFYAGLTGDLEQRYSLYKDSRYEEQYKTILHNIALGFSRSRVGIVPMQILRCMFLFEHFQVVSDHPELQQLEQAILEDLEQYNPETLEYAPLVAAEGLAAEVAEAAEAAENAPTISLHDKELLASFSISSKSQTRFFYTHIQLYHTRVLLGDKGNCAVGDLLVNIAKVYTPKVLSPAGYAQTLKLVFDEILKLDYHTYLDTLEERYLRDAAPSGGSLLLAPSDPDSSGLPSVTFWEHSPEVQTSAMLWSFHVLLDRCGSDASVIPRLYDIINTLHASLIKNHSGSVAHLNAALLITYYHRLVSDHQAVLNAAISESNAEDVLQSYIQRNMEPLDTPRNDSSERVLRVGLLAYSLPNNEYSALLFKIATHLKLFDEDFAVYLYNEQSFRSSSDAGVEHQFKALLDDNYYSHPHPLYSTFAENAEGIRSRIESDNIDILIFTHMEYTDSYAINLKSAPCQIYLSLFDKMYSSTNINSIIAVSDGYRQVNIGKAIVETFTIETPLTMTPTTTPDNKMRQLLRGIY